MRWLANPALPTRRAGPRYMGIRTPLLTYAPPRGGNGHGKVKSAKFFPAGDHLEPPSTRGSASMKTPRPLSTACSVSVKTPRTPEHRGASLRENTRDP